MREPEQGELFEEEDFFVEALGGESDAEALASAGFATNESYNEQNWDDLVYGN